MKFVKMHGLGNDFVFFGGEDARRVEANDPAALAQKLCRKHFGVCADGLVLILPSASCDARMRIFNPDGSEGGLSSGMKRPMPGTAISGYTRSTRSLNGWARGSPAPP